MNENKKEAAIAFGITMALITAVILLIILCMWGCPNYTVYHQRLEGEAELARAQSNRMIAVQEAEAKFEAASKLAAAEIERAKGVAQANTIIGDSLKNNESYLKYLWIDKLSSESKEVIYVPTENNLPMLMEKRK